MFNERMIMPYVSICLLITTITLSSSCEHQDKEIHDHYNTHIIHLNLIRFEDRLVGAFYAREKLLEAGEKAIPSIVSNMYERDALLVTQIEDLLMKMPRNKKTLRAFEEIQRYGSELSSRHSESKERSAKEEDMIFNSTVHWSHRSEIAANLVRTKKFHAIDLIPLLQSANEYDQKTAITALNKLAFGDYIRRETIAKTRMKPHKNLEYMIPNQVQAALKPLLITLLKSSDLEIGRRAALTLGWFGDSTVVPTLIDNIVAVDPYVQEGITVALSAINDSRAIDPVIKLLRNGRTPYVRASAADALIKFQAQSSVKALIEALNDKEWLVRQHSAITLESYQDLKNIESFVQLLSDEHPHVRLRGLYAIGKFGDISLKDIVSKQLNDPNVEVRMAAEEVIHKFENGKWPERGH